MSSRRRWAREACADWIGLYGLETGPATAGGQWEAREGRTACTACTATRFLSSRDGFAGGRGPQAPLPAAGFRRLLAAPSYS